MRRNDKPSERPLNIAFGFLLGACATILYFVLAVLCAPPVRGAEPPAVRQPPPVKGFAALAPAPVKATDPAQSVVFVQHNSAAGTGTVIACEDGRSLVLTCAHVVEHAGGTITVTTRAGVRHAATYLAGSQVRQLGPSLIDVLGPDLCVLSVDAELPAVAVADESPAVGAPVQLWGYGGQAFGARAAHKVGQWDGPPPYLKPTAAYTIHTISGDSGAGVFDARGRLVAVHHGADGRRGLGTPLATVRGWLAGRVAQWFPRLAARLAARPLARAIGDLFAPKATQTAPPPREADPPPAKGVEKPKAKAATSDPTRANGYVLRQWWDGQRWHQVWERDPDCVGGT